jgi:hypothetical protein
MRDALERAAAQVPVGQGGSGPTYSAVRTRTLPRRTAVPRRSELGISAISSTRSINACKAIARRATFELDVVLHLARDRRIAAEVSSHQHTYPIDLDPGDTCLSR